MTRGDTRKRVVSAWVYRHISQEVCPFVQKFSVVAEERDYAARESWEAVRAREDVSAGTPEGDATGASASGEEG